MPDDTPKEWLALYNAVGGRGELAKKLDVASSTLWRWSRRKVAPSGFVRSHINSMCAELGLEPVFVKEGASNG